jgi:ribosomal protein S18 acetylase RimI-like enzyme
MSISTVRPSGLAARLAPGTSMSHALAVALVAAGLGYLLHHLPPLRDHPVTGIAVALAAAVGAAFVVGALAAGRGAYRLPTVLVATRDGPAVERIGRDQLDFCAALHAESLEHGFFVQLGHRFLREYYSAFLDSPHAVALAATVSGQPVGELVGALRPRAHTRWMLRHRGAVLAFHGAIGMALHPGAALRFVRTRCRRYTGAWLRHRSRNDDPGKETERHTAVLSHVAVVPGARGIGAGRELVRAFEAAARRDGAKRAVLSTLEGDAGAGSFYSQLGWMRSQRQLSPDGRGTEEWERTL